MVLRQMLKHLFIWLFSAFKGEAMSEKVVNAIKVRWHIQFTRYRLHWLKSKCLWEFSVVNAHSIEVDKQKVCTKHIYLSACEIVKQTKAKNADR